MNLIDKIVGILNHRLFDTQLDAYEFSINNVYGLSYLSTPTTEAPQRPFTYFNNEPISVDVNDGKNITLYHRVTDIAISNDTAGFGDSNYNKWSVAMLMVVYADREKVGMTNEDLVLKSSAALNYVLTSGDINTSGLGLVRVTVKRANIDSLRLFRAEYGANADCPLQFNSCYFGIEYQIEIQATSECMANNYC